MEEYVDTSRLRVRLINKSVAKQFVEKNHYTKRLSSARYTLGLFHVSEEEHMFFDGENEELIGCLVYGHPVSNATVTSVFNTIDLELSAILELTRLVIFDGYGKNIESYFIGQSFKWLKENDPQVKVLISYADPEQNHTGLIYRATNWLYQGCGAGKLMPDFSIKALETDEWMHSRTVGSVYGSRNINSLAEKIGHTFWRKEEFPKHRYIYFLGSKTERKKFKKDVKVPILPYDEIRPFTPLLQKIIVNNGQIEDIELIQGIDIGWKVKRGDHGEKED